MKNITLFLSLFCFLGIHAQTEYHEASAFTLLGKATQETETLYERLPAKYHDVSRPELWYLGKNTAGLAVRFTSNSTSISLRWESLNNYHMDHMTDVGVKGLDLYCLSQGKWRFVNSARPQGKQSEYRLIENMELKERNYMLYLPLYDGISSLQIGVDSLSYIRPSDKEVVRADKPVGFYGTSILQGGCASRPGMASTNILSRWLNRECINLGFSGNAFLDYEIAELMSAVDAAAYVLDFVPNVTEEQIETKMETFYKILRDRHAEVPVFFVEDPMFTHADYDRVIFDKVTGLNRKLKKVFHSLVEKGEKNIHYVSSEKLIGADREGTVDGIHATDLGMLRYAELMYPLLKRNLK